jgi:hypothetical protein
LYLPKIDNNSDYLTFKSDAIQFEWKKNPPSGLSDFNLTITYNNYLDDKSECITLFSDTVQRNLTKGFFCLQVYPTFLEFVRFLILRPDLHDEHWMSFGRHCAPCLVDYDAIVKLETSTRDETFVMTRSGIGRFAALEFKNPTFGGKTEEKRKEFYSTIPCNVLEQLIAIYRMDLDMFDYDVDSFRQICDKGNSSTASIVS